MIELWRLVNEHPEQAVLSDEDSIRWEWKRNVTEFRIESIVDNPTEIFYQFFPDDFLQSIEYESPIYVLDKNLTDRKISVQELRIFLAIVVLSTCNTASQKHKYWSTSKDTRNVGKYLNLNFVTNW